uniref:NADH dehydrogenase subunit 3 n=1 Tax=Alectorobius peruvianus TaxID=879266 RepID=UPI00223722C1|nr:NADH dehydrogenase subunit 3 [Alectorobius peruvianus]UYB78528.1 NADH dehydrogenase subunit 3 [Alectorobius peruvianus]
MPFLITSLMIIITLVFMASVCKKKNFFQSEKNSPFECGFDPFSLARQPFSLRYFMISIIFLIFDIEIVILLPYPLISNNLTNFPPIFKASLIIFLILLGLLYEWKNGMIQWL